MSPDLLVAAIATLAVLTHELLLLSAIGIFFCSVDDVLVDCLWLAGMARRADDPPPAPPVPGRFAILIPAWDESAVLGPMLSRLLATLAHPSFEVFVGCYPNDPATARVVREIADPRLHLVLTARPGPTTKADCLNQLWRAAERLAADSGRPFRAVVLHDAEDVVHPQSLGLYDCWLSRYALVQLPVLPLMDRRSRWIAGHYGDEFAEAHGKDMMVRTRIGAPVPSAGVGVAVDCRALRRLAGEHGQPFAADSLTEDYELGYRLHRMGFRGRLVRQRLGGELVATREYFPATIAAATRQKARWLTGIALAGWDRLGWAGDWRTRWMLLRDRKGLFAAAFAAMAYGGAAMLGGLVILRRMLEADSGIALPPLFAAEKALFLALLSVNAGLLLWRLLFRAGFVAREYGAAEALCSLPRALVGNVVNFLAAMRAAERYQQVLAADEVLPWDKTEHRFPTAGLLHA